jgi:hypothetical protein
MPSPAEQFPIVAARSYAGGAIQCLSIADAFERADPRRADRMLEEALAGLDAARDQIRAAQTQALARRRAVRRPVFSPAATAAALAGAILPWLTLGGLPS